MKRGFSQLEVLIAVAILAIGILGVVGSLAYSTQAGRFSERTTEAVQVARELMDKIRTRDLPYQWNPPEPPASSGLNDAPEEARALAAPPFSADFPADSPFRRNIRIVPLTDEAHQQGMVQIRVEVRWTEQGHPKSVHFTSVHRRS